MPTLKRPDDVEIHWEERGQGPLVLVLPHASAYPAVYRGLIEDLASDCRVVTYDPRGSGSSTREQVKFSTETDVADLAALLRDLGGASVCVGAGDGFDRATRVAVSAPELVTAAVACGATPLGPGAIAGTESMGGSPAVINAMLSLGNRSPRSAVRSLLEQTNPEMDAEELRERVEATVAYASAEALQFRLGWFTSMDAVQLGRALGERLWIAHWDSPWVPKGVQGRLRELVPEANMEPVAEGPISRPDLTAEVVRKALSA